MSLSSPPSCLPVRCCRGTILLVLLVGVVACSKHNGTYGNSPIDQPKVPVTKEDKIIAQARAALGNEDCLLAVKTLTMTASIYDAKDTLLGTIHFQFKKPASQRSDFESVNHAKIVEASNGLEGWTLTSDKNGTMHFDIVKSVPELQNIYTAMENLYFYRATELVRGSEIVSSGPLTYRNNPCWKVSFHYPDSITYDRYIDQTSGELRGTILQPSGIEFVEQGKKVVAGIAFPLTLNNYTKEGKLNEAVKFESVEVNAPIDDKVFEMPSLLDLNAAAKAAKAANSNPAAATSPSMAPSQTSASK